MDTLNQSVSPVNVSQSSVDREKVAMYMAQLGGLSPAERFVTCGEGGHGYVGVCRSDECSGNSTIYHSFGCMLRICPRCASAASRKLADKLTPAIKKLVAAAPLDWSLKHIILTTNISLIDYMKFDASGRLISVSLDAAQIVVQQLRRLVAQMFKDQFAGIDGVGWAIGIEFGANFMLHFHVLALIPYWEQNELSKAWRKYSNGRGYVVRIRRADDGDKGIGKAVGYVSKYVTKPLSTEKGSNAPSVSVANLMAQYGQECLIAALWYVFKGVRRFQTYGSFYDLEIDEELPEVCPDCGGKLTWMKEVDFCLLYRVSNLSLIKTNNLSTDGGVSPPKVIQLGFPSWVGDVDFWK